MRDEEAQVEPSFERGIGERWENSRKAGTQRPGRRRCSGGWRGGGGKARLERSRWPRPQGPRLRPRPHTVMAACLSLKWSWPSPL